VTAALRRGSETVARTLREYADRGVFRAFTVESLAGGRTEYQFTWLTRRPTVLRVDRGAGTLTFVDLLTHVDRRSAMARELAALVAGRTSRALPGHKRIDARRASIEASIGRGTFSLVVSVRGAQQKYATRYALNLVNELFLLLHEKYPEYLVEHFGLSSE
jgi:hypothetical protein